MALTYKPTLINISKQLRMNIGDVTFDATCFAETLIISCCHDRDFQEEDADSESSWICEDSVASEDEVREDIKPKGEKETGPEKPGEEINTEIDESVEEEQEEDFFFFFFDELRKRPPPVDEDASVIVIEDIPQINPRRRRGACVCYADVTRSCTCGMDDPCFCGRKLRPKCICGYPDACVCPGDEDFTPMCVCDKPDACVCYPESAVRPKCTCGKPEACICFSDEEIRPICVCGQPDACLCCNEVRQLCVCANPEACLCSEGKIRVLCKCGNPGACICLPRRGLQQICKCNKKRCDCAGSSLETCTCASDEPCACPAKLQQIEDEGEADQSPCLCIDGQVRKMCTCCNDICTCSSASLGAFNRQAKDGDADRSVDAIDSDLIYRCHDIDPRHTFFDYGYGRRDKIGGKVCEEPKKFEIQRIPNMVVRQKLKELIAEREEKCVPPALMKRKKKTVDCCMATGGICISIERIGRNGDRFMVQISSQFSKDGCKTGTKLISIVDTNLHTLEENRTEHITRKDVTKERRHYIAISKNGYYNKVMKTCDNKRKVDRIYHTFSEAHDFILEGANIVLLRLMALKKFKGEFQSTTTIMNGDICDSFYDSSGPTEAVVNRRPVSVLKVSRIVREKCGLFHVARTVLTMGGYIVSHEWDDCNYIFHINPLLPFDPETNAIVQKGPLRQNWQNDLELLSNYLDFKMKRKNEGETYISEHPEIRSIIADYLQTILVLKPSEVLHFTRHYFRTFIDQLDLPHNEFFDPCHKHVRYYYYEE